MNLINANPFELLGWYLKRLVVFLRRVFADIYIANGADMDEQSYFKWLNEDEARKERRH